MPYQSELINVLQSTTNDKVTRNIAISVLFVSFLIGILFSELSAFIILGSYVSGVLVTSVLLKYENQARNFATKLSSLYQRHFLLKNKTGSKVCSVCNGSECFRHQFNSRQPWKSIFINKELNHSIENFFDHILEDFINSWYATYTTDKSFLYELKHSIRYGTAAAVKRFLELDIGQIIANKLIPCGIKHVDDYLCMVQIAELKHSEVNKIAVDYLGKRLHIAASSRTKEISYLQNLATALTERLLPAENLKCKNFTILLREILSGWVLLPLMDVLADPHIINQLVLLTKHKSTNLHLKHESNERIEFLYNFSKKDFNEVALAIDLKIIMKEPEKLFFFMQFLKREGVVHLLQFCLNIEDFNSNLLKPDLTKRQLEELHADATSLYNDYLDPQSDNFINCPIVIVSELKALLDAGVYNVAKLQTTEPLFKASEFAFELLENEWLPLFYHSPEFYLIIGGNKLANNTKSAASSPFISGSPSRFRQKRYENQGAVAKLSNSLGKIKGALQTKPVDGSIYPHESRIIINETSPAFVEDFSECSSSSISRNLSTWRISIPSVVTRQYGSKTIYEFNIDVQRTDALAAGETRHWIVKRRDADFYTLKSKLSEFHGENEICNSPLPARRSTLSLDSRKAKYEDFLKTLLEKPVLRGSDLLYTFLTWKEDFTLFVTTSMPVVDLENIYQSVAHKLRKEKGQHLDSFLVTFFNSTSSKIPKFEWAEMGDEIDFKDHALSNIYPKTFKNSVFGDNYGVSYKRNVQGSSSSINPNGITESTFYLLKHIFRVREPILKLYVAICSVAKQGVESMCRIFIERKIKSSLSQPTLAFLINELEELIFGNLVPTTEQQRSDKRDKAFKLLEDSIPNSCNLLFGKDFKGGLPILLKILQNPFYNKQLAYSLIDIVISEMYPELDTSDEFY